MECSEVEVKLSKLDWTNSTPVSARHSRRESHKFTMPSPNIVQLHCKFGCLFPRGVKDVRRKLLLYRLVSAPGIFVT
jgi:hypothetical protein